MRWGWIQLLSLPTGNRVTWPNAFTSIINNNAECFLRPITRRCRTSTRSIYFRFSGDLGRRCESNKTFFECPGPGGFRNYAIGGNNQQVLFSEIRWTFSIAFGVFSASIRALEQPRTGQKTSTENEKPFFFAAMPRSRQ